MSESITRWTKRTGTQDPRDLVFMDSEMRFQLGLLAHFHEPALEKQRQKDHCKLKVGNWQPYFRSVGRLPFFQTQPPNLSLGVQCSSMVEHPQYRETLDTV